MTSRANDIMTSRANDIMTSRADFDPEQAPRDIVLRMFASESQKRMSEKWQEHYRTVRAWNPTTIVVETLIQQEVLNDHGFSMSLKSIEGYRRALRQYSNDPGAIAVQLTMRLNVMHGGRVALGDNFVDVPLIPLGAVGDGAQGAVGDGAQGADGDGAQGADGDGAQGDGAADAVMLSSLMEAGRPLVVCAGSAT